MPLPKDPKPPTPPGTVKARTNIGGGAGIATGAYGIVEMGQTAVRDVVVQQGWNVPNSVIAFAGAVALFMLSGGGLALLNTLLYRKRG